MGRKKYKKSFKRQLYYTYLNFNNVKLKQFAIVFNGTPDIMHTKIRDPPIFFVTHLGAHAPRLRNNGLEVVLLK